MKIPHLQRGPHAPQAILLAVILALPILTDGLAVTITGYSAAQNDRFASGFPTAPVSNTNPGFIGVGLDWSGVGWTTQTHAASSFKGLALLSPLHFLTAQHYEYANNNEATTGVRILDRDGQVRSSSGVAAISNLGRGLVLQNYGNTAYDLAIGRLQTPVANPSDFVRMPVLDLHNASGSDTLGNYTNLAILHYGRSGTTNGSPRVGPAVIDIMAVFNSDARQVGIRTPRTTTQLQVGDSSAPTLYEWTNPEGGKELTLLGVNSTIDSNFNYISAIATAGGIAAAQEVLNPHGFALRSVGNSSSTWSGGSGSPAQRNHLSRAGNWSSNSIPTDRFVIFDPAQTSFPNPVVNDNTNLRGVYFRSTAASNDAFTFNGSSTLTLGRGGITNYDGDRQIFNAPLALGAPQFWDAGPGGVSVQSINLGVNLLEIRSPGPSVINGVLSGSGRIALESGQLQLAGPSTYTGATWVHEGTLNVTGSIASSTGLTLGSNAFLVGTGRVPGILGRGVISPGVAGAGIMRAASVNPAEGLNFDFSFSTALPQFEQAAASGNSVLRVDAANPVTQALGADNRIRIFLKVANLQPGDTFRGGFFASGASDFLPLLENASWEVFLADENGAVLHDGDKFSRYTGPLPVSVSSETQSAAFVDGTVNGRILQLLVEQASFEDWAENVFPEEVPEELRTAESDANGDGVSNLMAYALGVEPMQIATGFLPGASLETGPESTEFAFQFRRNRHAGDVDYVMEVSENLIVWSEVMEEPVLVEADVEGDGRVELVEIRLPVDEVNCRKFARLRVRLLP